VGRASAKHRKPGNARQSGRHRDRARGRTNRTIKIVGVAAPAVALVGTFVALQAQPAQPDPVATSMAAYHLQPLLGAGSGDAGGSLLTVNRDSARSDAAQGGSTARHRHAARAGAARRARSSPGGSSAHSPAATLTCTGTPGTGMLPQNYATIVSFLVAHGYTDVAAAGIAGNIYQESDGNPESVGSGGGGLIGWTPLPAGYVTGDVTVDLQTQLQALLAFNQQWAQYIPELNAAAGPAAAADIYMTYFERPGLPAAYNREDAAVDVAQACGIPS
jgi:hypothetical protein